jgi:hypothetical protein
MIKVLCGLTALVLPVSLAAADPLRLRSDAFLSAEPPVGLLVLQAENTERDWLDAEALVWTGVNELDDRGTGDALVVTVRARDPQGRGEARVGRFIVATGAIMPRHIDGASARARSHWGTDLELFGGVPVAPRFGVDAYDWIVGGRVSHRLHNIGVAGISYVHQRDRGFIADEEVGLDAAATPTKWLDIAARAAVDIVDDPGISDARLSAAAKRGAWRFEAFGVRRSPSRLLPATSLFSALGDVPSDELGLGTRWRAAPRLDVWMSLAYRGVDDSHGGDARARASLRLDDKGKGVLMLELHRQQLDETSTWSGVRAVARLPVAPRLVASTELELVVPDQSHGRGSVWPWALGALAWQPAKDWEAAAAVEMRASPENTFAISSLLRLARRWGAP